MAGLLGFPGLVILTLGNTISPHLASFFDVVCCSLRYQGCLFACALIAEIMHVERRACTGKEEND
jgi:hypothetical protein